MNIKIQDPQGKWYTNSGAHTYVDSDTGCRYEQGAVTKGTPSKWLDNMSAVIREVADPLMSTESKPEPAPAPLAVKPVQRPK